jgi:IS5 family transposase
MRNIQNTQVQMGEIDISSVQIEVDTRDEIPQLLRGLQWIYSTPSVWRKVQRTLWQLVPVSVDPYFGRNGMSLWQIFVLGTLRLCCNWDYDKLQEIANNHMTLRQMLGHGILDSHKRYPRQTLCDNIRWFTPEILEQINQLVVQAGHGLLGVDSKAPIHGRCDSFVVETDVHFPTDINLLWDAVRKVLTLTHRLSARFYLPGWRQTAHNLQEMKKLFRQVQRERDRDKNSQACLHATRRYIDEAARHFCRAKETIAHSGGNEEIRGYIRHGERQIRQIYRRCFQGKRIPASEKVYSLFEEYTEWISKGKAGVPQELGLGVCIVESDYGFIMHHRVMEQESDKEIAVPLMREVKRLYRGFCGCSFDKGFHSPDNQRDLRALLTTCVLPKKGKRNEEQKAWEESAEFKHRRSRHAAVESAISALENHSLDRCYDFGIEGFRRYVALAVVARNIQILGHILQMDELEKLERKRLEKAA